MEDLEKNKARYEQSIHKWWFNNKKVGYCEYGGGAELIDEYGQVIADFPRHLDLEWMIDTHLKLVE